MRKTDGVLLVSLVIPAILCFAATPLRAADTSAGESDDATISLQVKTALLYHLSLNFQVMTKDGVVIVDGSAVDAVEKIRNTKLISEIEGVKAVVNNMAIPATAARSATVARND